MKKIVVIGSGICGTTIARQLSKYSDVLVTVLEKYNDISCGTTKANSGIVHAGFDAVPNTNKAKYNVLGNAMFDELSKTLDFPFRRNGSLVLCFDKEQLPKLEELKQRGEQNGLTDLEIIDGEKVAELEPHLNKDIVAALWSKTAGIVSPYEMAIAYAENANVNGVEFVFNCEVKDIEKHNDVFTVSTNNGEFVADFVINCAGVNADDINNMIVPEKLHITARKGDYVLLDKEFGYLSDRTLFQPPSKYGKGVLIAPTTHGNILMGPTAVDVEDKVSVATKFEDLSTVLEKASLTMPDLPRRGIITQFSGLRAHSATDDFIIGESSVENFYNVAGIESPGLTAAPAIAVEVENFVKDRFDLQEKADFIAERKGIPFFSHLTNDERQKLIDRNPLYGNIVCRCEVVTEGEIVDAINRPVGATDLDGIKRRTRAGMGRCQMGFCSSRVMEILARERQMDMTEVTKSGGKSNIVLGKK